MKNLFILTVFALIALTSCKKDYTCECTFTYDGEEIESESVTINNTKSKAADECDEGDSPETEFAFGSECEIK